jgi:hypothetical protein
MLIHVTYTDDSFDYVKDFMLDSLIESGTIAKFRRSTGWVEVGSEPLRHRQPDGGYNGVERRGCLERRAGDRRIGGREASDRRGDDRRSFAVLSDERSADRTSSLVN